MDRRAFLRTAALTGAGTVAGVTVYGTLVEPRRLETTRHRVHAGRDDPVTLVQISDLHLGTTGAVHDEVVRTTAAADPDVVLLTGDSVEDPDDLGELDDLLGRLPARVPVLAIMGNWEYWGGVRPTELARLLRSRGGRLLVNESLALTVRGRRLVFAGVDDLVAGRPDILGTIRELPDGGTRILMAHCPAHRDELSAGAPVDLVLSGHTHGGQVNVGGLAVTPPGSGDYRAGWYRDGGPPLYVSRGVGTSVVPVRIGAPPEVALFDV